MICTFAHVQGSVDGQNCLVISEAIRLMAGIVPSIGMRCAHMLNSPACAAFAHLRKLSNSADIWAE